jgi:hypothetical protein
MDDLEAAEESNASTDPAALLIAAEARIDTAMSQLILTTRGVTDATTAQAVAIAELRKARKAIKLLREKLRELG